jgi:hypothetical protein
MSRRLLFVVLGGVALAAPARGQDNLLPLYQATQPVEVIRPSNQPLNGIGHVRGVVFRAANGSVQIRGFVNGGAPVPPPANGVNFVPGAVVNAPGVTGGVIVGGVSGGFFTVRDRFGRTHRFARHQLRHRGGFGTGRSFRRTTTTTTIGRGSGRTVSRTTTTTVRRGGPGRR